MFDTLPPPALTVLGAVAWVVLGLSLLESGAAKLKGIDGLLLGRQQYVILPRLAALPAARLARPATSGGAGRGATGRVEGAP